MGELLYGSPPTKVYAPDGSHLATLVGGHYRPISSSELNYWMVVYTIRNQEQEHAAKQHENRSLM